MSKVKIQGNASGTGVVTLTAPNTNTDRTITLPDDTQTLIGTNASGNVGIGTANPAHTLELGAIGTFAVQTGSTVFDATPTAGAKDTLVWDTSNSGSEFAWSTNGTERMRILSTGGLTFNGDTAAANALDDYETGTWTPVHNTNGFTTATQTLTGTYIKVGSLVHLTLELTLLSGGYPSSYGAFSSLPFVHSKEATGVLNSDGIGAGQAGTHARIQSNLLYYYKVYDSTVSQGRWNISITYQTNS